MEARAAGGGEQKRGEERNGSGETEPQLAGNQSKHTSGGGGRKHGPFGNRMIGRSEGS